MSSVKSYKTLENKYYELLYSLEFNDLTFKHNLINSVRNQMIGILYSMSDMSFESAVVDVDKQINDYFNSLLEDKIIHNIHNVVMYDLKVER